MTTSWVLFQPLDRAMAGSPRGAGRSAVTVARVLAVGHILGGGIGMGNLLIPGALHPGWQTTLYAAVMGFLFLLGTALAFTRRPGSRLLTLVVFSSMLSYLVVAVCVVDAAAFASPLMLLFGAVASAMLLGPRAFPVAMLMMPVAVTVGLGATWTESRSMLGLQAAVQSTVLCAAMVAIYWLRRRAERLLAVVVDAAQRDHLTGLLNRRGTAEHLVGLDPGPLLLLALDLDHFKDVNDQHGHAVGDRLLKAVARRLEQAVPAGSLVARVGGEEFLVLMPLTDPANAAPVSATVHAAVGADDKPLPVTASAGAMTVELREDCPDRTDWLWHQYALADQGLYEAKQTGRNQVIVVDPLKASLIPSQLDGSHGEDSDCEAGPGEGFPAEGGQVTIAAENAEASSARALSQPLSD